MSNLVDARKHVADAEWKLGLADGMLIRTMSMVGNDPVKSELLTEAAALSANASAHLSAAVEIRARLAGPR